MPGNPDPFDPEIEASLEASLAGYVNVDPPAGAAARWRRTLRSRPRRDRFLGLSARAWAAACALCLAGTLILAVAAWRRLAAPVPQIVFAPPAPAPPLVSAAVPARAARLPLAPPPRDARALYPTAQERLLSRLVADQPGALTQLFAEPMFQPPAPPENAKPTGEKQ